MPWSRSFWDRPNDFLRTSRQFNVYLGLAFLLLHELKLANPLLFLNPLVVSGRSANSKIRIALAFQWVGVHGSSDQPINTLILSVFSRG